MPLAQSLLARIQSARPHWVTGLVQALDSAISRDELDLRISNHVVDSTIEQDLVVADSESLPPTANSEALASIPAHWPELHVRALNQGVLDVDSSLIFVGSLVVAQSGTFTRRSRDASLLSGASIRLDSEPIHNLKGTITGVGDLWHHYHFMLETLPQLLRIQQSFPETSFVTSSSISPQAREALEFLDIHLTQLPRNSLISAEKLIVCDRGPQFLPRPSDIQILAEAFTPWGARQPHRKNLVYASRSGSSRNPTNIDRLETALAENGVEVVDFSQMSLRKQVATASLAQVLIGCHGAGLVNSLFLEQGSAVIELSSGYQFERCYESIARARPLNYSYVNLPSSEEHPHGHLSDRDVERILAAVTSIAGRNPA